MAPFRKDLLDPLPDPQALTDIDVLRIMTKNLEENIHFLEQRVARLMAENYQLKTARVQADMHHEDRVRRAGRAKGALLTTLGFAKAYHRRFCKGKPLSECDSCYFLATLQDFMEDGSIPVINLLEASREERGVHAKAIEARQGLGGE